MQHRDYIVLQKVLSEIDVGVEMLGSTDLQDFMEDEKLKRALCMTVINVGELIKNITPETRTKYPEIPWREIAGMRDMAAHKYQTLRMEDVFQTVQDDFPSLRIQLTKILKDQ